MEVFKEIQKDFFRQALNKYTKKALQMLPKMDKPCILDIGCGSGVATMELARLTDGQIVGLDIDQRSLDEFNRKVKEAGFSDRVKIVKCSMFEMDFPDESFDIIWAEGSIFAIRFRCGLVEWGRLLKRNGFLVVHDSIENTSDKLEQIGHCGYGLLGSFTLPGDVWWTEYYEPLERRIKELRSKYWDNSRVLGLIDKEQREIDMVKKDPKSYGSVFFVMQKK